MPAGPSVRLGEEALALARRRNNESEELWVRWHLALAYGDVGRFDEAIEALEAAVEVSRASDDPGGPTWMLMLLGETQMHAGLRREAKSSLEEALRLAQGVGIEPLAKRISSGLSELAASQSSSTTLVAERRAQPS
jgi:tetratricopeptide (TPR) repeat protein